MIKLIFKISDLVFVSMLLGISSTVATKTCLLLNGVISTYDSDTQICCNGSVSSLVKSGEKQACFQETRLYFPSKYTSCGTQLALTDQVKTLYGNDFICCGGVFHRTDKGNKGCCAASDGSCGFTYNPGRRICCNGTLHNLFPTTHCCGTRAYDNTKMRCEKDGAIVAKTFKSVCNATIEYDVKDHVCCQDTGELIPRPKVSFLEVPPRYGCFKGQLYDQNKFRIIQGVKMPMSARKCGDDIYFNNSKGSTMQICCGDVLKAVNLEVVQRPGCCGREIYDENLNTCHQDRLLPYGQEVCNSVPFNTGTHECCNGKVIDRKSFLCCGPISYMMKPVLKEAQNHTDCCKAFTTYNRFDMECNGRGEIVPITSTATLTPTTPSTVKPTPDPIATRRDPVTTASDPSKMNTKNLTAVIKERIFRNQCPKATFCNPKLEQPSCKSRYAVSLFTYDIKRTASGTKITAIVMNGSIKQGKKVLLRTKARCQCIRVHELFRLYTNRDLLARRSIRVKKGDFFVQESSQLKCIPKRHKTHRGVRG